MIDQIGAVLYEGFNKTAEASHYIEEITEEYGSRVFQYTNEKLFDTLHEKGTLHTVSDLLTPTVRKIHEFLVEDQGFLGGKFQQFTKTVSENPYSVVSRLVVFSAFAFLAKRFFVAAYYPKYEKNMFGGIRENRPVIFKRAAYYLFSLAATSVIAYEVLTLLSGRAACTEGFQDCVHPLWTDM